MAEGGQGNAGGKHNKVNRILRTGGLKVSKTAGGNKLKMLMGLKEKF